MALSKEEIYKWWHVFKNDNELVEIRSFGSKNISGYFKNIENLVVGVEWIEANYPNNQIYFTLNQIDESCYSREQCERMVVNPKCTTNDLNVTRQKWVLVDLDCKRAAGVSSSNEEFEAAHHLAVKIYKFLMDSGFYEPVVAVSGNGYHIDIPCDIPTSAQLSDDLQRFLKVLDLMFSNDKVSVDCTNKNASRLCKLYGTMARKGTNTPERPHRLSQILKYPDDIKPNAYEYFKKIADLYPEEEKPSVENNFHLQQSNFDLDAFLQKHNIEVERIEDVSDGKKYILKHCVFDDNHKGKDAVIFKRNNGAIGYFCFHNSCVGNDWRKVREKFEPDAYSRNGYKQYRGHSAYTGMQRKEFTPQAETDEKGKKWLSMSDILYVDLSQLTVIPTGYTELDRKIMGLLLGDVTILSGISGAGKTSWLDCVILNVIQNGFKVAVWSGELQDYRFQNWIDCVAAGKNHVVKSPQYENVYYTPRHIADKINGWLDGKLYLYNNKYRNRWAQLFSDIKEIVEKENVNLVVLDNLMALNIADYDGAKYEQQTQFINDVKEYAKEKNIHVILVCHPRKEGSFLRAESISGTADLVNLCDNLFILHRVGRDFEARATEFFGASVVSQYCSFDTVIECCKNRMRGVKDELFGLYYEHESRRLKNSVAEHTIYGWEATPVQQCMEYNNYYDQQSAQDDMPFAPPANDAPF